MRTFFYCVLLVILSDPSPSQYQCLKDSICGPLAQPSLAVAQRGPKPPKPTLTRGEKGRAQWINSDDAGIVYTLHPVISANGLDSEAEAEEGGRSGVGIKATSSREQKK